MTTRPALPHTPDAEERSPAGQLLQVFWELSAHSTVRQRQQGLKTVLEAAICARVAFALTDFAWLTTNTVPSYYDRTPFGRDWLGNGEWAYRLAIVHRNRSAQRAIEQWKGRQPFVTGQTTLYVGASATWHGQRVTVTRFLDATQQVVLCQYADPPVTGCPACGRWPSTPRKVMRIYRLSPHELGTAATGHISSGQEGGC